MHLNGKPGHMPGFLFAYRMMSTVRLIHFGQDEPIPNAAVTQRSDRLR
jgi:hypothetical protein